MLPRVPTILAAALYALAGLLTASNAGAAARESATLATNQSAAAATNASLRGTFQQEVFEAVINLSADEDDVPDRIIRFSVAVIWPTPTGTRSCDQISSGAIPTHRVCATPARAPPAG